LQRWVQRPRVMFVRLLRRRAQAVAEKGTGRVGILTAHADASFSAAANLRTLSGFAFAHARVVNQAVIIKRFAIASLPNARMRARSLESAGSRR
jgi:hypothetical protein